MPERLLSNVFFGATGRTASSFRAACSVELVRCEIPTAPASLGRVSIPGNDRPPSPGRLRIITVVSRYPPSANTPRTIQSDQYSNSDHLIKLLCRIGNICFQCYPFLGCGDSHVLAVATHSNDAKRNQPGDSFIACIDAPALNATRDQTLRK